VHNFLPLFLKQKILEKEIMNVQCISIVMWK